MKFIDFIKPHRHKVLTPSEEVYDIEFCIDEKDNLAYKMNDDPEIKPIGSAIGDETIVGDIRPFAGAESDIPDGWLPCFGQNVLIENYRDLYDVIEDTYNDSTTLTGYFRLPDLRNRFIEGSTTVDGNPVAAGIPDIWAQTNCTTGSASPLFVGSTAPWVQGAFSPMKTQSMTCTPIAGSGSDKDRVANLQFKASAGQVKVGTSTTIETDTNKVVYGKSDTVQPPALKMIYIIRWKKANFSNPEYAEDVVVGDIRSFAGTSEKVPTYWHICDGTELPQDEYPELFAVIGTKYNTDTTPTGKFALPNLINKFVEGSGDLNVGEDIPAGLPNITGSLKFGVSGLGKNRSDLQSGAFYTDGSNVSIRALDTTQNSASYTGGFNIDASMSDSTGASDVYGNSNTVQPPAVKMLYIIRLKPSAINTTSEEVIIGDIRAFATNALPSTWIICRGQNVKQSAYPELFAVIGTMYNNSSTASDEFGIPDLTGRFIQGALAPDGTPVAAGIPNIQGRFSVVGSNNSIPWSSGAQAFGMGSSGTPGGHFQSDGNTSKGSADYYFNAAEGECGTHISRTTTSTDFNNNVYGKSTTVQPPAYKMVYAIRAKATNVDCILQPLPVGHDGDMLVYNGTDNRWEPIALYKHIVECYPTSGKHFTMLEITNRSATPFTSSTLYSWLNSNGFTAKAAVGTSTAGWYICNGGRSDNACQVYGIAAGSSSGSFNILYNSGAASTTMQNVEPFGSVVDVVLKI